jgi:16S rRNA (guanine1516-N2)-methyltransferase
MPDPTQNISLCVVCEHESKSSEAKRFALDNDLPLLSERDNEYNLQLIYGENIIELFDTQLNTSIFVDFVNGALAHRQQFGGGRGQAIAKAIGLKQGKTPTVLDVTAGLARDAYILATLGCKVTLVEQSPVLYTLIKDGIERALTSNTEHSVKNFTNLILADSKIYIEHAARDTPPDVIYIDPMYPERKKSALVKKDMQILHKLIGHSKNEKELLETALKLAKHRVVIKRPIHAQPVTGMKPTMTISSKKTRYDVYVVA